MFTVTVGARFDSEFFSYVDINARGRPVASKSFTQLSPRLGILFSPRENVTVKALAARAFRAPAPSELFGANTWTLASNIAQLLPEVVTSVELAGEVRPARPLT